MELNFKEIAKALVADARNQNTAYFDFSNMDKLATQLEDLFILRKKSRDGKITLKSVAEYVKRL